MSSTPGYVVAAVNQVYHQTIVEKARANAESPHPPHEFRDSGDHFAPDSAAELSTSDVSQ